MIKIKKNALRYKDSNGVMQDTGMLYSQTGGTSENVTDTTLTQAGVPADAKATGDKISELSEEVDDLKALLVDGNGVEY